MTATNHALTGAVIALAIKQPVLAVPLAFLSHFVLDMVLHLEARDLPEKWVLRVIGADLLIGNLLAIMLPLILITDVSAWTIFLCMVIAMSPDYIWCWRYVLIKDKDRVFDEPMSWFSHIHKKVQKQSLRGAWVETVWLIGMVLLVKLLID
ncbi:MAG TPA: hypothetical protein VLE51_00580 [Candidatus Saccharimonadales bacterium]|nr:hypothetical protein [Candidatus Saccharimonadales bacterium]